MWVAVTRTFGWEDENPRFVKSQSFPCKQRSWDGKYCWKVEHKGKEACAVQLRIRGTEQDQGTDTSFVYYRQSFCRTHVYSQPTPKHYCLLSHLISPRMSSKFVGLERKWIILRCNYQDTSLCCSAVCFLIVSLSRRFCLSFEAVIRWMGFQDNCNSRTRIWRQCWLLWYRNCKLLWSDVPIHN